jgi:hypothetical protein
MLTQPHPSCPDLIRASIHLQRLFRRGWITGSSPVMTSCGFVIACDKREAFAQGSVSDEAIQLSFLPLDGLLRGACHRAALRADPLARNDGVKTAGMLAV